MDAATDCRNIQDTYVSIVFPPEKRYDLSEVVMQNVAPLLLDVEQIRRGSSEDADKRRQSGVFELRWPIQDYRQDML